MRGHGLAGIQAGPCKVASRPLDLLRDGATALTDKWNTEMRKRTVIIALASVIALALAAAVLVMYERTQVAKIVDDERAWDLRDASPQMRVIISEGGMVARYLTEDEDNYIGDIQDSVWIPKSRAMVETWYASDGRGIIFLKEFGVVSLYAEPDSTSDVVGNLIYEEGDCPCTYDCCGFRDGWFAVGLGSEVGYINEEYVQWDTVDTF